MNSFLVFVSVGVIGVALGWLIRAVMHPKDNGAILAELKEQVRFRDSDLASAREALNSSSAAKGAADAARTAADQTLVEFRQSSEQGRNRSEEEARTIRERLQTASGELSRAEAQLAAERQIGEQMKVQLAEERQLREQSGNAATAAGEKAATEMERLRVKISELEREQAKSVAELSSEKKALLALQLGATEYREQHDQLTRKNIQNIETAAVELRQSQEALAQTKSEVATTLAQLNAERRALGELRLEFQSLDTSKRQLQEDLLSLRTTNGALDAKVKLLDERVLSERKQIETVQEKFRSEFEAISNKLLLESSSRFNVQSSESLEKLLNPLKENLANFKASLDGTRQDAATQSAVIKDQIERISSEASNLAKALKGDVKVLGNWGENMLYQILEKSGLQKDVHYRSQHSGKDTEGDLRLLDVIIDLPNKRNLVIDSKASLKFFEESVNCTDDEAREVFLERHVDSIRRHIRELGQKRYHELHGINAPDFVLMYIPIEAAYFSAISREPALFGEALEKHVVLITNSTLLATLRTVSHVWQLAAQQKNAVDIALRGGLLYDKFVGFVTDLERIGDSIKHSQEAWEAATNKLQTGSGNLVRQAEQLRTLGARVSKTLPRELVDENVEIETAKPPRIAPL